MGDMEGDAARDSEAANRSESDYEQEFSPRTFLCPSSQPLRASLAS